MQIAHCPVIARDNAFLSSRLIAIRDLRIKMKINDPPSPSSHCNSTRRETLDADIDSSMNERTRVNGSHTGSDATTFQLLESSIDQTSFLLSLSLPFAPLHRKNTRQISPSYLNFYRPYASSTERGRGGEEKKRGKERFRETCAPTSHALYIFVRITHDTRGLAESRVQICLSERSEAAVNAERYTIRR